MKTINMRFATLTALVLLVLVGCGRQGAGNADPSANASDGRVPATDEGPALEEDAPDTAAAPAELVFAPHWMPEDWDRNVYNHAGVRISPDNAFLGRQRTLAIAPFVLWELAHHSRLDEAYQPAWGWWVALRSCARGIQLMDDLAGEFGDRTRGAKTLTQARQEFKEFAASQPDDFTVSYLAELGRWDDHSGKFALQAGPSLAVDPRKLPESTRTVLGALSTIVSDNGGKTYLMALQADRDITSLACVGPDGKTTYTFDMASHWYLEFGARTPGRDYLEPFTPPAQLPDVLATREQAAALAQRNPERKVLVTITVGAEGEPLSSVDGILTLRGELRKVVVTDLLDGSILASKTY